MKEQLKILVKLYRIEAETAANEGMLKNYSRDIDALADQLKESEDALEEITQTLDTLKKEYRALESDSQMVLSRIRKSQAKLHSVKTNKEYDALLKEIDDLKLKNSQLEDKMIACLDRLEAAETTVAQRQAALSACRERCRAAEDALKQKMADAKAKLEALDGRWKAVAATVQPDVLKMYINIRERTGGIAMALAENEKCHGCHLNIPPQLCNELIRGDSLKLCPHCQRILFWENLEERPE